jgi:small subunit ribosomal protein S8
MWSDPIADLLTQIRNGVRNHTKQITLPFSGVKLAICHVLRDEGFILGAEKIEDDKQGKLRIQLKYGPRGEQVINEIHRESKAGCRKYVNVEEIPQVLNGLGIAVLSTSAGVMSDRQCREKKIGGELLCTLH